MEKSKAKPESAVEKKDDKETEEDIGNIKEMIQCANESSFFSAKPEIPLEEFKTLYEARYKASRKEADRIATRYIKADKAGYLEFVA